MADEDYTDLPTEEQLPVPAIAIDTYRHLWHYKWPYLGQLAIWTILAWIVNKPTRFVSGGSDTDRICLASRKRQSRTTDRR